MMSSGKSPSIQEIDFEAGFIATNVMSINFFQTSDAQPADEDQYFCTAFSRSGLFQNNLTIKVQGKFGTICTIKNLTQLLQVWKV